MDTNAELQRKVALIENFPAIKQLLVEEDAKRLQTRRAAAARRALANTSILRAFPGLEAEVAASEAELAAFDAARPAILERLRSARVAKMTAILETDQVLTETAGVLENTIDPVLVEGITFFRDLHDELRKKRIEEQTSPGEFNAVFTARKVTVHSNIAGITAGMSYCMAALKELEAMKLEAVPDLERIAALKRGIPDAEKLIGVERWKTIVEPGILSASEIEGTLEYVRDRALRVLRETAAKIDEWRRDRS